MIRVPFTEPLENADWKKWRRKAEDARRKLEDKFTTGEAFKIREQLYKEMRQTFLDAFHGKCAYCERKIILDQHQGDVEHFRPKGRVMDRRNRPVMVRLPGSEPRPHPGYPWLAYDWRNLLPACAACNQPGRTRTGKQVGKWDRFPVARERDRAAVPGQELREKPLLLHPVFDHPDEHLELDPETGLISAKSRRGRETIEILHLNREGLFEARRETYKTVSMIALFVSREPPSALVTDGLDILRRHDEGEAELSWAGRLALAATPPPPGI